MCTRRALRIGLPSRGEIAIGCGIAPTIDPRRARGRAIILELAEARQMLARVGGLEAVDLLQDLELIRLVRDLRGYTRLAVVVPDRVLPPLIARERAVCVRP